MGGDENVSTTAGIWGFIILFALALACWLLFRSMNTRLRRVRYSAADEARDREAVELSEETGESERQAAIELDEERLEEKGELEEEEKAEEEQQ